MTSTNESIPCSGTAEDRFASVREARVVPRCDLEASRHLYHGKPAYVLRDPVNFESHRLSMREYRILSLLSPDQTLGDTFETLVAQEVIATDDEESFFGLIVDFQQLGLLSQTANSGSKLYERFERRERAARKLSASRLLFMRLPLWNPDRFLERTMPFVSWLFSPAAVGLWALWILAAAGLIVQRWGEFVDPLSQTLATRDFVFMWMSLLGLKVVHEFGHGYACKRFGGSVPEMGAFMLIGNPCAYVDASAAWGFPQRWQRVVVSLGGMYFESFVAAAAVFVWAFTDSVRVAACAHQVVIMASLITLLFNMNPLMKYDGYFILCDLTGFPNLKRHSDEALRGALKRRLLGVASAATNVSRWVLVYGAASSLYRVSILLAISAAIALKVPKIGLGLAVFYCGYALVGMFLRLWRYLLTDAETADVRGRAISVGVISSAAFLASLFLVPAPVDSSVGGYIGNRDEYSFRFSSPVVVSEVHRLSGDSVREGQSIVACSSQVLSETASTDEAAADRAWRQLQIDQVADSNVRLQRRHKARHREDQKEFSQRRAEKLVLRPPFAGQLVVAPSLRDLGKRLEQNSVVATVVRGDRLVRAFVDEATYSACLPEVGDKIKCQFRETPSQSHHGVIERVLPATTESLPTESLAHTAGGDLVVDPSTNTIRGNVYELQIRLDDVNSVSRLHFGSVAQVRLKRRFQPLGWWAAQQIVRFVNTARTGRS